MPRVYALTLYPVCPCGECTVCRNLDIILIVKRRPDKEDTLRVHLTRVNGFFRGWRHATGPGISSNRTNKDLGLDISRHPCTVRPKMFHEVNCFSVVNRSEINPGLTPSLKALKAVLGPLRRYPRFNLSPSSSILRFPLFFSDTESSSSRCRLCAIVNEEEAENVRSWTFYLFFLFLGGGVDKACTWSIWSRIWFIEKIENLTLYLMEIYYRFFDIFVNLLIGYWSEREITSIVIR